MTKTFLDNVHGIDSPEEIRTYYDDWAETYDDEIIDNGYASPMRVARALAAQMQDLNKPILDFGCGTGLSGAALIQNGFTSIDGADLSAEMLAQAREKGVYRDLWQVHPGNDLPFDAGKYAAITAVGVIGSGAAPVSVLDLLIDNLGTGGLLAFSFNDKTLADDAHEDRLRQAVESGKVRILFSEYGDHLPKFGMGAMVYIVHKE